VRLFLIPFHQNRWAALNILLKTITVNTISTYTSEIKNLYTRRMSITCFLFNIYYAAASYVNSWMTPIWRTRNSKNNYWLCFFFRKRHNNSFRRHGSLCTLCRKRLSDRNEFPQVFIFRVPINAYYTGNDN